MALNDEKQPEMVFVLDVHGFGFAPSIDLSASCRQGMTAFDLKLSYVENFADHAFVNLVENVSM